MAQSKGAHHVLEVDQVGEFESIRQGLQILRLAECYHCVETDSIAEAELVVQSIQKTATTRTDWCFSLRASEKVQLAETQRSTGQTGTRR